VTLSTPWGEALAADPDAIPLPEHPRPLLVRDDWAVLNGWWDAAFTALDAPRPAEWGTRIRVPFSPEAPLSGVNRRLGPDEALWYRLALPEPPGAGRVLLHFGAVDRHAEVWIGEHLVARNDDGFLPFSADVTDALAATERPELVVRVTDPTDTEPGARGKQSSTPGGIWYSPQSGIWQTVWWEVVPERHVRAVRLDPVLDPGPAFDVTVDAGSGSADDTPAHVTISAAGRVVAEADVAPGATTRLELAEARLWSPADPFLHDVEVRLGDDVVRSYAGLRVVGRETGPDGASRLTLNGEPILHAGLLDQGYWPDGLLTPPDDDALAADIRLALDLGFTMLRKHIKVEPARWYHHADRLGMLVWQDMVNGGGRYAPAAISAPAVLRVVRLDDRGGRRAFGRDDSADRERFERSLERTIEHLRGHPSIVLWVPFNEGWGQFDAVRIAARVRDLDPTRLVDHASGWHDQGAGDLQSLHVYFRRFRMPARRGARGRAVALTEFGGYSLPIAGHRYSEREFGYKRFRDADDFRAALAGLWRDELAPAVDRGLAAFVYTQLSDVEDEANGLISYDRKVTKVDAVEMRTLNDEVARRFARAAGRAGEGDAR